MIRLVLFALLLALAACTREETAPPSAERTGTDGRAGTAASPRTSSGSPGEGARAALRPVGGSGVRGTARLVQYDEGLRVEVVASGLRAGLHGLHVHTAGDCAEAAASGHLDPVGAPHGDPEDPRPSHHAGDLGNLRAYDDGARLDRIYPALRLDGPASVAGQVLVVHEGQDDLNTQPDGGAGDMVACGVIRPDS